MSMADAVIDMARAEPILDADTREALDIWDIVENHSLPFTVRLDMIKDRIGAFRRGQQLASSLITGAMGAGA